jgi:hypothetical protein
LSIHGLEEKLKKAGVSVVCSRQDTIISVKLKGLSGKDLVENLRTTDLFILEKVKTILKTNVDPTSKLFLDPTFGPLDEDQSGAAALCKNGQTVPSKGGSQHQVKVLGMLKSEKIRWERPNYASDECDDLEET